MLTKEELKELVNKVGGVHRLSMMTDLTPATIYRVMSGDVNPSYKTSVKLNIVNEALETLDEELINA